MAAADSIEVDLHLHSSTRHPIELQRSGPKDLKYNVRISAIHRQTVCERGSKNIILKILREYDCIEVKGDDHNEIFNETDFFTYSVSTTDLTTLGFTINVFNKVTDDSATSHLGQGHITPLQLSGSNGTLIVPLIDKSFQTIGTISVDYLLVKPWHHPLNTPSEQDRHTRGLKDQKKDGSYVCGHRGAGESFGSTKPWEYPENTISAFKAAHRMGIDFAEMDVQISKDNVPVIFHDTMVKLCLETFPSSPSKESKSTFFEIPVKDLTAEQMKTIKVWEWSEMAANQGARNKGLKRKHDENNTSTSSSSKPDVTVDYMLFPTLEEALCEVPQELGFFIELKYPFREMYEESIDHLCIDKNQFVDSILQVIFDKAGARKILLGCFDPDICVLCQSKQSRHPVFLITQGQNTIWDPYLDIRARTTEMAVAFAKSENLDGIHIFSSLLFDRPASIEKILQKGLTLIAWGHENDKPEKKKWLVEHGVHCVQVDDIFESTRNHTTSD
ncbi:glycerophosphocholine phosphodiesterase GPCPD1-like [Actinia tenebrosa]|uniref:Glycerophosphocholine phosphodiesterase GPCPD1-like n=1 Tax=Actinia tenebrosa TaxID=6105 RepID=A0A6P8IRQ2_ACTTE|nr:glycerophosphocholine phosphodiesterase GPCPD1-like [Actinia tenebrosa]